MSLLTEVDSIAVARALLDIDWQTLPASPWVKLLLSNMSGDRDKLPLMRLLGPDISAQVNAVVNPAYDPPLPPPSTNSANGIHVVPELPVEARLTDEQNDLALQVGKWERDYTDWASRVANITPRLFHQGGALFLGGLAIGRRMYLNTTWGEAVHPNLYVMNVALSTYYAKTAALRLTDKVARQAITHMLLPEPGSPENFRQILSGAMPQVDGLSQVDKERFAKSVNYAAQRGIIRDELSGLFKAMGRDYMAGMKELIMLMYDCPDYLDSSTVSRGLIVIRNIALSLIGGSTPVELSCALSGADWNNGLLARFALLTPEADYKQRPDPDDLPAPDGLTGRLKQLHEALPEPPLPNAIGDRKEAESWSLSAPIWPYVRTYHTALRQMTGPDGPIDDRLRGVYGRLHVQALKVAIILTAMDWSDAGQFSIRPKVTPAHWFRAQQIVETWRESAHRLLRELNKSEDSANETRIYKHIGGYPLGETLYELTNRTGLSRKTIHDALQSLVESGMVEIVERKPARGPTARSYRQAELEKEI